jgi:membrane-bound lytic murein transglycosylase F
MPESRGAGIGKLVSMKRHLTLLFLAPILLLGACTQEDSLDGILERGELLVVSRNSPTTFYLDKTGPAGFEYALAGMLAQELNVELVMEPAFSLHGIFTKLRRQEAHLAAAGLTLTDSRSAVYPHSIPYEQLTTQVVYVAGNLRPRKVDDLIGMSILTLADSSHAGALKQLKEERLPDLVWTELPEADTMELLEALKQGEAQLALIDSSEFAVQQSLYPRLKVAFDLSAEQDMVWYLPPESDNTRLLVTINRFIHRVKEDGTLARLREIHFGHTDGISRISSHTFSQMMRSTLPPYRNMIQEVAEEYQMEWSLLAAIAYQESHWNPRAESPTGVRGMMMLTLPTAREMAVDNRLDAGQSLRGGARYFKNMKRRLPEDIQEPDRTWMALAAYNIGLGHLEDARVLTEQRDGDPHRWRQVMESLPLLQKSAYYKTTRHGYARGIEAVTYVQNIRHYHSILQWQEIPQQLALPPLRANEYFPSELQRVGLKTL